MNTTQRNLLTISLEFLSGKAYRIETIKRHFRMEANVIAFIKTANHQLCTIVLRGEVSAHETSLTLYLF